MCVRQSQSTSYSLHECMPETKLFLVTACVCKSHGEVLQSLGVCLRDSFGHCLCVRVSESPRYCMTVCVKRLSGHCMSTSLRGLQSHCECACVLDVFLVSAGV